MSSLRPRSSGTLQLARFLRSNNRKISGKDHRYFSMVENHRLASDRTVQRTVLYLGEINDEQQAAWRKTLSVFDEEKQGYANLSLFPDDREIPGDAVDSLQVNERPRTAAASGFGSGGNWGSMSFGMLVWGGISGRGGLGHSTIKQC